MLPWQQRSHAARLALGIVSAPLPPPPPQTPVMRSCTHAHGRADTHARTCTHTHMHRPLDYVEEVTTGQADLVLVNSRFTRGVFAQTFTRLARRGLEPQVSKPGGCAAAARCTASVPQNFVAVVVVARRQGRARAGTSAFFAWYP